MVRCTGKRFLSGLVAAIVLAALGGCGEDSGGGDSGGGVSVELSGDPVIGYDAARGRTSVVVQFIARGRDGVPLEPSDVEVDMKVDGQPVDNESVLQASSQELVSSLLYALVLDASGSMLQHNPSAFAPMKTAARDSVQAGLNLWRDRPGTFDWDVCWFNDFLFHRQEPWNPNDILQIPEPPLDAATKLYAAVEFMAIQLRDAYQAGKVAGPRDHHVIVVLSDGADNLSGFDNSQVATTTTTTGTGARYDRFGWAQTTLDDAVSAIRSHPSLTVHVLAMGSNFKREDLGNLKRLAAAGGGQFLENPSSSGTSALFERVTKEFSTLQTHGASIPQPAGEHEFTLEVRGKTVSGSGSTSFRYRAGPDAQLLH